MLLGSARSSQQSQLNLTNSHLAVIQEENLAVCIVTRCHPQQCSHQIVVLSNISCFTPPYQIQRQDVSEMSFPNTVVKLD